MMIGTKEEMDGTNSVQHLKKKEKKDFIPIQISTTFIIPNYVRSFYHSQKILPEDMMAL